MRPILTLLLLAAVTVPLQSPEQCQLDEALISTVPPATVQVLAVWQCGALRCWERYTEQAGERVRSSRACEAADVDGRRDQITPVPPAAGPP